jgi:hypothetical protein
MQMTHLGILGALLLEGVLQHLDPPHQVGLQVLLSLPLTLNMAKKCIKNYNGKYSKNIRYRQVTA